VDLEEEPKRFEVIIYMKSKKRQKLVIKAITLDEGDARVNSLNSDVYEIEIKGAKKIQKLLEKFSFDFDKMASSLRIMNNRMILLNPKAFQDKNKLSNSVDGEVYIDNEKGLQDMTDHNNSHTNMVENQE